jgi:octaheme c-type cytochrome (tetrathionate reductase family)
MSNEPFCNACHIGYGWKDDTFDFSKQENVDCLVCHDTTGVYKKAPGMAGHPAYKPIENPPGSGKFIQPVDLKKVAQAVGKTSRDTCGACHFFGGGGDGVKHGDLDSSLSSPSKELDVHMDAVGNDFTCATCHMTTGHQVPGSRYAPTAMDKIGPRMRGKPDAGNPTTCQACHGDRPHPVKAAQLNNHGDKLNDHARIIACETCHTPSFARGGVPTKMSWDWSTAGKLTPEGKPFVTKDDKGHVIYDSRKGDFVLSENVVPGYTWFNGTVKYTLLTDKIEMIDGVIHINSFAGSPDDGKSMIWPVKVFRGSQPYDPVNQTLVVPHTTGSDDTGYWKNFNWEKAITTGHGQCPRAVLRKNCFRQNRNVLAHRAHDRAQGRSPLLPGVPQHERTAEGYQGRLHAGTRRQQTARHGGLDHRPAGPDRRADPWRSAHHQQQQEGITS